MKKVLILLLVFLLIFCFAPFVFASEINWPNSPMGTILDPDGSKTGQKSNLSDLVKYLYEWGIALGGLITFFSLIIGGFQYLTSAGSATAIKEAQERISSAIFGLILLLGSWLILNTINPQLTTFQNIPLNLEAVFTKCDSNEDCPEGYDCTDCIKLNEEPNPKCEDGKKEGICAPTFELKPSEACEEVEITTVAGEIYSLTQSGECKNVTPFDYFYSEGYTGGERNETCTGTLQLYGKTNCVDMITSLGVQNPNGVSLDRNALSIRFLGY